MASTPPGAFIPWAMGPRVCTGKMFSQVEFVSVIARLLRRHLVEPVRSTPSESAEDAAKRILVLVEDSSYDLLLKAKRPGEIRLRWRDRETRNMFLIGDGEFLHIQPGQRHRISKPLTIMSGEKWLGNVEQ